MQNSRGCPMSASASSNLRRARTCGGITGSGGTIERRFCQYFQAQHSSPASASPASTHPTAAQPLGISTGGLMSRMAGPVACGAEAELKVILVAVMGGAHASLSAGRIPKTTRVQRAGGKARAPKTRPRAQADGAARRPYRHWPRLTSGIGLLTGGACSSVESPAFPGFEKPGEFHSVRFVSPQLNRVHAGRAEEAPHLGLRATLPFGEGGAFAFIPGIDFNDFAGF